MIARKSAAGSVLILLASLLLAVASGRADSDPADAVRGRRLYREGIGDDGRSVVALGGTAGLPLPPAFSACIHCHGDDGRGKTEAGRTVPAIRGETLDVPYASTLADGRRRSPYKAASFFTALTQGLDSSGHPLDATMPRYHLSEKEAADLLTYLKTIGLRSDEGVTDDTIRIGFLKTADPAQAEITRLDRQVIAACFADINQGGGIHRRKIELQDVDAQAADSPPVLLLLTDALATTTPVPVHVPVLCATTEERRDEESLVFSLFPGATERARALINYATAHGLGEPIIIRADVSDDTLKDWRDAGVKAVLLSSCAGGGLTDFGDRARALGWNPWQLWLEHPPVMVTDARALTVEAVSLSMISADALADYRRWATLHNLPAGDLRRQLSMVSLVRLLGEALKGAGHELSRAKLVTTLEAERSFQTGFTLPLGFSSRRHTATNGIYVVPLAASAMMPLSEWVSIE